MLLVVVCHVVYLWLLMLSFVVVKCCCKLYGVCLFVLFLFVCCLLFVSVAVSCLFFCLHVMVLCYLVVGFAC